MSAEFIATVVLRASLLLALGLAALHWLPGNRPQLRRLAALTCLAASLVLPFVPGLAPLHVTALPEPWQLVVESKIPISAVFATVWGIGITLALLQLAFRLRSLNRWLTASEPMSFPVSAFPVRVSRHCTAPCVAGFFRPLLIVPEKAREWDEAIWRCVLAHELQHVRQGDLWLGWISHAVRVLHWWNPLAWKLSRNAGLECEACCDDAVLRLGVQPADYARVLLRFTTVETLGPAVGFSIHGRGPSSLRLRMERLLASAPQVSAWRTVAVACLLLTGMAGCLWFAFDEPSVGNSGVSHEATLRWQANPFPGDAP